MNFRIKGPNGNRIENEIFFTEFGSEGLLELLTSPFLVYEVLLSTVKEINIAIACTLYIFEFLFFFLKNQMLKNVFMTDDLNDG